MFQMLQVRYWVTAHSAFVCQPDASWGHWVGKCCYSCLFCTLEQWLLHNHGLYQDDRLIIVDNFKPRNGNVIKKKLHWLFDKFAFKLDVQTNLKITDYLDISLNDIVYSFRLVGRLVCFFMVYQPFSGHLMLNQVILMKVCLFQGLCIFKYLFMMYCNFQILIWF